MGKEVLMKDNRGVVYSTRDYTMFYKELNRVRQNIRTRPIEDIFHIKYKGFVFNCLPFLLNGTGYFSQEYRGTLTDSVARLSSTKEPVYISEFCDSSLLDVNVFKVLLPSLSDLGVRMLGVYQFFHEPKEMVKLLLRGSVEVFEECIINGKYIHFDYEYKEICNTQAFSYYVSILWLLSLSPSLKAFILRDLKKSRFAEVLDSLIPASSIHYKYISGEIGVDELCKQYVAESFPDGSSIASREIMCNSSEGKYKGEPLNYRELTLCNEVYSTYTFNEDYRMNTHLAYCFLFNGTYKRLEDEITNQTALAEREQEKARKATLKLKKARCDLDMANKELREKDDELSALRTQLGSIQSYEDLEARVVSLEERVKSLDAENNQLFTERLKMKKLISTQKKQLKSLSSSLVAQSDTAEVFEEESPESEGVDFDAAVDFVKGLRLIYVGHAGSSIDAKLASYGLDNITKYRHSQRQLGKCDAIVVFTIRCHHDEVYRIERLCGGRDIPFIYLSCVNVEQMITEVYKLLKD